MKLSSLLFNLSLLSFLSCQDNVPPTGKEKHITIDIQPFADIPKNQVKYVFSELAKIYPHVELKEVIQLPPSAFHAQRNRFRADSLINFLNRIVKDGHVTIGLTNKDISTTKGKIEDWGIMGLAFCPGNACVVSTFRLSKDEVSLQLLKTSVHELGHTEGLSHCPVKTCFMRDAEGGNTANEEHEFCVNCKTVLLSKGWNIK